MKLKSFSKYLTFWFSFTLLLSVLWTVFGNDKTDTYGPVILMLFGSPILFLCYWYSLRTFSSALKHHEPDLFKKNRINNTLMDNKLISPMSLFNNKSEFQSLKSSELTLRYKTTMKALRLSVLAFVLIIPVTFILWFKN